ncbi:ATP-binding protein [Mucisphaera calidilacus]|uniref:histidine kinase n=1 Tax=Mucisphaera calidilacus TaxID=2527982 RepID=A0A518BT84_9BACT|nr:ATP-binding protein [Mucisphaera calidilacus]QDU70186.1 Sporulation kinase E [Mucisphaera calidilacus]
MLVMTVLQGPDKGRRFELPDNEPQMIGRSSESLPLSDQTISRRHASLTPDNGKWVIHDLKSSNGTFVNGVRVTSARTLRPGDQVRTGSTLMVFGDEGAKAFQHQIRLSRKGEMDISVEHTVAANDESMIMAVPEPSQAAEFQLRVVYELVALIGSMTEKRELLEKVMDVIFAYFNADRGFILLKDGETELLEPVVIRRKDPESTHGREVDPAERPSTFTVSRTIVQYVMRKGFGVLSANAMTDRRFATGDSVQAYNIRSTMCVPIKYKGRLYGVIQLDSQVANYTYTEDQLTLLTAIGVQSGLALANLDLVEARVRSERLAAVGQTVASLSHSIKNILQGMRGGADVVELGMRKQNLKVISGGWEIVARNQERIYELAMNMLAYSKQREPELEMGNVEPLLRELVLLMQQQYDVKKVALLTDFAEDVPPVPIDASGMHQAVLNLLSNALDAVEPETGVVALSCTYDAEEPAVRITVVDNGEGMTKATQARLFEPFHSTKGLKGTGLGLVVTKKIIEEHGGRILVESTREDGTSFTLVLPVRDVPIESAGDTMGPSDPTTDFPDD